MSPRQTRVRLPFCCIHASQAKVFVLCELFVFFFVRTGYTYMLELINLLQKVLVLSKAKRAPTTGNASTKTTKGKLRLDPILANASVHWLALQYVCSIRLLGITFKRFLQSDKRGFINIFTVTLFISWTTFKASISTIRLLRHRSLARVSPSLRAHNSAIKLLVESRLLEKPIII